MTLKTCKKGRRQAALLVSRVKHRSHTEAVLVLLYLEKLHSDAGKHELKERRDDQDVADGSDGHKHTLHHILRRRDNTHSLAMIARSHQVNSEYKMKETSQD